MSIQTDIELLSIQAMEAYAKKFHISGKEASDIFHQYQLFEKITIQHEYLHQVSFEEVMEYIEQAIAEDTHRLAVFHGTTKKFSKIAGILSVDETVERLRYNRVNNQISFHTEKALESLKFVRRQEYE